MYPLLLKVHGLFAVLTVVIYIMRGILFMRQSPIQDLLAWRILSHGIYSAVLVLGVSLAILSHQWSESWLITKVLIFVAAVVLAVVAFRKNGALPRSRRLSLWGLGVVLLIMVFAVLAYHFAQVHAVSPGGV